MAEAAPVEAAEEVLSLPLAELLALITVLLDACLIVLKLVLLHALLLALVDAE